MDSRHLKALAVIGCGLRADTYLSQLKAELANGWRVAGLADPNPLALEIYKKQYGNPATLTFASGPELIAKLGDALDAVIIASPNQLHLESVLPALKLKLVALLEKPVAITVEDCRTMWQSYTAAGMPPLTIGFGLRYTPFYRKVRELIDNGTVGQILTIEATEMMGVPLTSVFTRGWRRDVALSGPVILEKCCHDMDILRWIAGSRPAKVSSFATLTRFLPEPRAALRCRDCALEPECRYSSFKIAPYWASQDPAAPTVPLLPQKEDDLCVFNSEKSVTDHQVVNVQFASGVLASFTVCMDQPRTTRTIKVNGTRAQIAGDLDHNELVVSRINPGNFKRETIEVIPIKHDGSTHGGGDGVMTAQFRAMLRGDCTVSAAGMREGIEACLLALAAEMSASEGRIVPYEELEQKVF